MGNTALVKETQEKAGGVVLSQPNEDTVQKIIPLQTTQQFSQGFVEDAEEHVDLMNDVPKFNFSLPPADFCIEPSKIYADFAPQSKLPKQLSSKSDL